MPRLRNTANGVIVNVDDATAARLPGQWVPLGHDPGGTHPAATNPADYATWSAPQLRAEIQRRNVGRSDADRLPTARAKRDMAATLEADDRP